MRLAFLAVILTFQQPAGHLDPAGPATHNLGFARAIEESVASEPGTALVTAPMTPDPEPRCITT